MTDTPDDALGIPSEVRVQGQRTWLWYIHEDTLQRTQMEHLVGARQIVYTWVTGLPVWSFLPPSLWCPHRLLLPAYSPGHPSGFWYQCHPALALLGCECFSSLLHKVVARLHTSCCIFHYLESQPHHLWAKGLIFLLFSHGMLQNIKCELVSCGKKLTLICSFWGYCEFIITGVLKIIESRMETAFTYQHEQ